MSKQPLKEGNNVDWWPEMQRMWRGLWTKEFTDRMSTGRARICTNCYGEGTVRGNVCAMCGSRGIEIEVVFIRRHRKGD